MQHLITTMLLQEHLTQMKADNAMARHTAEARENRRIQQDTVKKQAEMPKLFLDFLPRLTGYPYSR